MRIKGKYKGNKKVELEQELNLPLDTEVLIETGPEITEEKKIDLFNKKEPHGDGEHFLLQIAKLARPVGRSDLSVKHHEVLGNLIE